MGKMACQELFLQLSLLFNPTSYGQSLMLYILKLMLQAV